MVSASNANTALASQSAGPQPALVLVGNKLVRIASEANSNNTNTTPVHTPAHVQARVSHANTDAAGSSDSSASEQEPNTPILIRAQHAGAEHNNQLSTIMLFSDRYQGPTTFQAMGEADDQLLQDLLATCLARQDSCLSASDVSWAARAVGGVGAGSNMHHAACEADMLVSRNSSTGADSAMDLTSRTHSWANCSNGQDVPDLELERDGFVDSSNNNTDSEILFAMLSSLCHWEFGLFQSMNRISLWINICPIQSDGISLQKPCLEDHTAKLYNIITRIRSV